ncbi:hypothetical protein BIW11_09066 [Tropilaelaps mercedesae]|uniref:Uncharacterized protein n=1 Tax=Tropilaelaps mercedesae TaxID=418985 RepID=A0A1V9XLP5_9ACAR|nr:hypothetical protein BIW11_09066 [Tropilaelaps mercedesae]
MEVLTARASMRNKKEENSSLEIMNHAQLHRTLVRVLNVNTARAVYYCYCRDTLHSHLEMHNICGCLVIGISLVYDLVIIDKKRDYLRKNDSNPTP